jgi:hypothetical protein
VLSQAIQLSLPTYSWQPPEASPVFAYAITSGPYFVRIVSSNLEIYTTNLSSAGSFTVTIKVTESGSGITDSSSFTLTVYCASTLSLGTPIADQVYFLSEPEL